MLIAELRLILKQYRFVLVFCVFQIAQVIYSIIKQFDYAVDTITLFYAWFGTIYKSVIYAFVVLMVLSYWMTKNNNRAGWGEIRCQVFKERHIKKYEIIPIFLCFLNSLLFLSVVFAVMGRKVKIHPRNMGYIFVVLLLYYLLPLVLAVFLGQGIASIRVRKETGFSIMLLLIYMFTGGFVDFILTMSSSVSFIYKIGDLFCIFIRGVMKQTDFYYLFSIEPRDWLRIVLWLLVSYVIIRNKDIGKWYKVFIAFVCMVIIVYCFMPNGIPYYDKMDNAFDGWGSDQWYYKQLDPSKKIFEQSEKSAGFNVKSYKINLDIGRILSADAILYLDKNNIKEYSFTLYHGYKVKRVSNGNGENLEFMQDGDHLVIKSISPIETMMIHYEGYSKQFYTSYQGVFLPAYFAYYPIPGFHILFDTYNTYEYPKNNGYKSEYYVSINTKLPLFCSGRKCTGTSGKAEYYSFSKGVTILASPFLQYIYNGDKYIVYSDMEYSERDIMAMLESRGPDSNGLKSSIIVSPYIGIDTEYDDDDYRLIFDWNLLSVVMEEVQ